ncbi:MAG: aminotransferase class I/II-fold pyridoxal phosphate-dependent enzyme [Lutibacter sp.]|jgi:1-aminocyclopropane-1-carboxylate synthase|nr:aminotransferase class I/II-fold pyridoxal phosphate-dependent enzyme [Lutibacter sp.]
MEHLSKRGQLLAKNPSRVDLAMFAKANENLFDPSKNPAGAFPLNVAENVIMGGRIREQFQQYMANNTLPDWISQYTGHLGHPEVRACLAGFMRQYFDSPTIQADNIAFSAGTSASLEACSFVLANPGDVVVIPAPAYPMYTHDLGIKSGMERYDLQTHHKIKGQSSLALVNTALLEETLAKLQEANKTFRMLLITSPDNPSGSVYSQEQLTELAVWCLSKKIHLVVNEIYALSRIIPEETGRKKQTDACNQHHSFAGIMERLNSDYLHLVYGLSKDFAISGLRFGILHSLNSAFIQAIDGVNIPHMVSNLTQWLVGKLFEDSAFIKAYIEENQQQISRSYGVVIKGLEQVGIPYIPSKGSLFVWADFSQFLSKTSQQGEEDLWIRIFEQTGVLLTPGSGFGHRKKGLFRLVHTAVPISHLETAMERLLAFLGSLAVK